MHRRIRRIFIAAALGSPPISNDSPSLGRNFSGYGSAVKRLGPD